MERLSGLGCGLRWQQAIEFRPHDLVALAALCFQACPVEYGDLPAAVAIKPAFCNFPAASVTPSRRTPSMLAINSCVIVSAFEAVDQGSTTATGKLLITE